MLHSLALLSPETTEQALYDYTDIDLIDTIEWQLREALSVLESAYLHEDIWRYLCGQFDFTSMVSSDLLLGLMEIWDVD